jgi:hypothetical protein
MSHIERQRAITCRSARFWGTLREFVVWEMRRDRNGRQRDPSEPRADQPASHGPHSMWSTVGGASKPVATEAMTWIASPIPTTDGQRGATKASSPSRGAPAPPRSNRRNFCSEIGGACRSWSRRFSGSPEHETGARRYFLKPIRRYCGTGCTVTIALDCAGCGQGRHDRLTRTSNTKQRCTATVSSFMSGKLELATGLVNPPPCISSQGSASELASNVRLSHSPFRSVGPAPLKHWRCTGRLCALVTFRFGTLPSFRS